MQKMLKIMILVCGLSLVIAYGIEFIFNHAPCPLCNYARAIYGGMFVFLVSALILHSRRSAWERFFYWGSLLLTIGGVGLSFFHSLLERKIIHFNLKCTAEETRTPPLNVLELQQRIENAHRARCDEINWEFFGLSLANYNILFFTLLSISCIYLLKGSWHENTKFLD